MNKPGRDEIFDPLTHDEDYFYEWSCEANQTTLENAVCWYMSNIDRAINGMHEAKSSEGFVGWCYELSKFSETLYSVALELDEIPSDPISPQPIVGNKTIFPFNLFHFLR